MISGDCGFSRHIAGDLFLSRDTIKSQAISIYRKLGASRSQAVTDLLRLIWT